MWNGNVFIANVFLAAQFRMHVFEVVLSRLLVILHGFSND